MAKQRKIDRTSALVKRDGALAVTFANTGTGGRKPLGDYSGLLDWGRRHGALTTAEAGRLERLAAERPDDAATAFSAAEDLHDLLSLILNARADHEDPTTTAVEALSDYLIHMVPRQRLVPSGGGASSRTGPPTRTRISSARSGEWCSRPPTS